MADPIHVLCSGDGSLDPIVCAVEDADGGFAVRSSPPGATIDRLGRDDEPVDCLVGRGPSDGDDAEWCAAVRRADPGLPLVYVPDADAGDDAVGAALEAGASDVVRPGGSGVGPELVAARIRNAVAAATVEPYRTIVESVDDPIYLLDDEGRIVLANPAVAAHLEDDRERLEGRHMRELMFDEEYERTTDTVASWLSAGETGGTIEYTILMAGSGGAVDPGGASRVGEANLTLLTDDDGAHVGTVGAIRDVTERNARERELGQYETIVETAPVGLLVVGGEGEIVWANDVYRSLFGDEIEDVEGLEFTSLVERGYYDRSVTESYEAVVSDLLSSTVEIETANFLTDFYSPEDGERIHDTYVSLLPFEEGGYRGTVIAFRDITERKAYERELERQNDRLEKFANLVSHDLRNPLNVAQGHLEIHAEHCESEALADVAWSLDRMESIVEDVLSLARYGQAVGEVEPVELASVVADAWAAVDTADATLDVDADATISADRSRVRALFENLFRNAVEHGGPGVAVTVGPVDDGSPVPSRTGFYVEDDGPGLNGQGDAVFELGHTTSEDGTGFGLNIVEQVAAAHGWDATTASGTAGGARFEVRGVAVLDG